MKCRYTCTLWRLLLGHVHDIPEVLLLQPVARLFDEVSEVLKHKLVKRDDFQLALNRLHSS